VRVFFGGMDGSRLFVPLFARWSDLDEHNGQVNENNAIGYLETTSSLSITADEDALRLDVVRVRDVVVRETGDEDFLADDGSVVVDVGRLHRDGENDACRCHGSLPIGCGR
jgi:hypothetical protein